MRQEIRNTKYGIRNKFEIRNQKVRNGESHVLDFSFSHFEFVSYSVFRISCFLLLLSVAAPSPASAATLTVDIRGGHAVTFVGAFHRWDQDGNLLKKVNPKAKIDVPEVDYTATLVGRLSKSSHEEGTTQWVFKDLPPGKYDLVILAGPRVRIEGFEFAPVLEFDPFYPGDATADDETREFITDHIKKSPQYENKVEPLYMGGRQGGAFPDPHPDDAHPRQAHQLRKRLPRRGHDALRDLAIHLELRRLGQGPPHPRSCTA